MSVIGHAPGAVVFALVAAGCSCATSHDLDADGAVDAFGVDAPAMDSDTRPFDAVPPHDAWARLDWGTDDDGVCRPGMGLCQTNDDCVAWAAAVGPPGVVVNSICDHFHCTLGTNCSTTDGRMICVCGEDACATDEICVSDAPGGPPRCELECVGR